MAKKKERHPSTLTLAPGSASKKVPIYGHLLPASSGNSPGSLPAGLPAQLPYRLPEPAKRRRKPALSPLAVGQHWPAGAWRRQPVPFLREPGALPCQPEAAFSPLHGKPVSSQLGPPLCIRQVAELIGCSPWTVRQTLIPRGLPHFRFKASGRLTFYQDQVIRWIESQQRGGQTTK
jgi:hypothetical protein